MSGQADSFDDDHKSLLRSALPSSSDADLEAQPSTSTKRSGSGIGDLLRHLDRGLSGRRLSRRHSDREGTQLPLDDRSHHDELADGAPPEWALLLVGCLLGLATGLCVAAFNRGMPSQIFILTTQDATFISSLVGKNQLMSGGDECSVLCSFWQHKNSPHSNLRPWNEISALQGHTSPPGTGSAQPSSTSRRHFKTCTYSHSRRKGKNQQWQLKLFYLQWRLEDNFLGGGLFSLLPLDLLVLQERIPLLLEQLPHPL